MKNEWQTNLILCDNCGAKAARVVKRPQVLGRGAKMILVDNLPIISCKNCSKNYMTSETIHHLNKVLMKQKKEKSERKVAAGCSIKRVKEGK